MVLVTMMSYKLAIKPLIPVASSEVGFPKTHWVMMGLKGLGGYDDEDTNMTRFLKIVVGQMMRFKHNTFV